VNTLPRWAKISFQAFLACDILYSFGAPNPSEMD
jgi:hypothetical protein